MSKNRAIRLAAVAALSLAVFGVTGAATFESSQVSAQSTHHGDHGAYRPGSGGTDW